MFRNAKLSCPCCDVGIVAFVLAGDEKHLVLLCLNCGTWFPSIEHDDKGCLIDDVNLSYEDPKGIRARDDGSIELTMIDSVVTFPPARWATENEIVAYGWGTFLDEKENAWLPETEDWWADRIRGII